MHLPRIVLATLVIAAAATLVHADSHAPVRAQLVEAINKRDTKTIESLVVLPLRAEKVRFTTGACRKFWGVAVLVHTAELPAFINCLATMEVHPLRAGASTDAVYGPGFPLGIGFNADDKVIALTSASEPGTKPLQIEPSMFAAHVIGFSREIAPSEDTKHALDAHGVTAIQAELSLCVDESGSTVPVATVADAALRSYEQDVATAARTWKIEPFRVDGKPQLACATYQVGYRASAIGQAVAVTSAPTTVDSKALEPLRVRGTPVIKPDDATKKKIAQSDSRRVIAAFKLCVDVKGTPTKIDVLKPGGYDAYDQKIMREMATWAYKPYVVAGSPIPVCTAVTFVYSVE